MSLFMPFKKSLGTLIASLALVVSIVGSKSSYATYVAAPAVAAVATSSPIKKSIRGWVACDGTTDDANGAARAFAAAKNLAFTLVVDCPVLIKVGMDISKTIFIDNGTTVEFTGAGKFTVDNTFIPAFALANSSNIALKDWNVEYDASLPINVNEGGYVNKGQYLAGANPGNAFNDLRITSWLSANRGIKFDRSQGSVNSRWVSSTNMCAIFLIIGDTFDVSITGMKLYVPANAGAERYIPVAFSVGANFKSNQTVSAKTLLDHRYYAIPSDITFSNVTLDGTYMGWVGNAHNLVFENITSNRYGDLMDANGNNVGGVGKWFAPPHLFYFSANQFSDWPLMNSNIQILNVVDNGIRAGTARDKGGTDTISGNALSLKLVCIDCVVDTYKSLRPDGFADVCMGTNVTISNVQATYNSSFGNNLYPGIRWPMTTYKNITLENVSLTDLAPVTYVLPIGNAAQPGNWRINLTNVQVRLNKWAGAGSVIPVIVGTDMHVNLDYKVAVEKSRTMSQQNVPASVLLKAQPAVMKAGETTSIQWMGREVNSCTGSGTFSGNLGTYGVRTAKLTKAGNYDFTVYCRDAAATSTATVRVVVQ